MVAEVSLGRAGIVLGLECSRLARNNADWHQLLEICAMTGTLICDEDGLYDPRAFNDRLVLGMKGQISEALCRRRHNASYADLAVMPTIRRQRQVVRAGGRGRSA
jgi:DNA invertase Pin-like site-specific DNA recombinase